MDPIGTVSYSKVRVPNYGAFVISQLFPMISGPQTQESSGTVRCLESALRRISWKRQKNIHPRKINGWNMSSWRFGSDHFPF